MSKLKLEDHLSLKFVQYILSLPLGAPLEFENYTGLRCMQNFATTNPKKKNWVWYQVEYTDNRRHNDTAAGQQDLTLQSIQEPQTSAFVSSLPTSSLISGQLWFGSSVTPITASFHLVCTTPALAAVTLWCGHQKHLASSQLCGKCYLRLHDSDISRLRASPSQCDLGQTSP